MNELRRPTTTLLGGSFHRGVRVLATWGIALVLGCGAVADAPQPPQTASDKSNLDEAESDKPAASPKARGSSDRKPAKDTDAIEPRADRLSSQVASDESASPGESETSPIPVVREPQQQTAPPLVAEAAVAAHGIRKLSSASLALYTDCPANADINRWPELFEQADAQWSKYFGRSDTSEPRRQVRACLMVDQPRFEAAGLLPDDLPPKFIKEKRTGYTRGNAIWVCGQAAAYYQRHLLFHEGTHSWMFAVFGTCGPAWYMEGMAELLGTHSLVDGKLELHCYPRARGDVPSWGRIEMVQNAAAAGRLLGLDAMLAMDPATVPGEEGYGWCWALTAFLDHHPRYRERFRRLPGEIQSTEFNSRVRELFADDWPQLNMEWLCFAASCEYGYDFERNVIDFDAGRALPAEGASVTLRADRGWQSSGLRLEAGVEYRLAARGRYQVADKPRVWLCEPGGVTIRYYRGRPLGTLLAVVLPDPLDAYQPSGLGSPRAIGLETTWTPAESGTLYLRINDSPAELADNAGELEVTVSEK